QKIGWSARQLELLSVGQVLAPVQLPVRYPDGLLQQTAAAVAGGPLEDAMWVGALGPVGLAATPHLPREAPGGRCRAHHGEALALFLEDRSGLELGLLMQRAHDPRTRQDLERLALPGRKHLAAQLADPERQIVLEGMVGRQDENAVLVTLTL